MAFADKTLTCKDCGSEFVFTAGEQEFYSRKGLLNEPARCPTCRATRRREQSSKSKRQSYKITCASCGNEAEVPFQPSGNRPVYCSECFAKQKDRH